MARINASIAAITMLAMQGSFAQSQLNVGAGGSIVNNTGSGTQYNHYGNLYCNSPSPSDCGGWQPLEKTRDKRDQLFVNLERYLVATNPTELEIFAVGLEMWLKDTEPFLTVHIRNPSRLPAEHIQVEALAAVKRGQAKSAKLALKKSKSLEGIDIGSKSKLFLEQGKEIRVPVGAVREFLANLDLEPIADFEFLGVGLSSDVPETIMDSFKASATRIGEDGLSSTRTAFQNRPVGIALRFKTIFKQQITRIFPVNFYFGKDLNSRR